MANFCRKNILTGMRIEQNGLPLSAEREGRNLMYVIRGFVSIPPKDYRADEYCPRALNSTRAATRINVGPRRTCDIGEPGNKPALIFCNDGQSLFK